MFGKLLQPETNFGIWTQNGQKAFGEWASPEPQGGRGLTANPQTFTLWIEGGSLAAISKNMEGRIENGQKANRGVYRGGE